MQSLIPNPQPLYPEPYRPPTPSFHDSGFDDSVELRRFIRTLVRRKYQILAVVAVVVLPVAVRTWLQTPMYRSAALVEIDPDPIQVLPYREIDRPSVSANYEMFMKNQDLLLRSPTLVSRIADRLREQPDDPSLAAEIPYLDRRLSVQRVENTQLFRLGYVSPSPEAAARVANLYADEYIKRQFENGQQTRDKARRLLQRELQALEERVQQSERELVTYAQTHRLSSNKLGDGIAQTRFAVLDKQTAEAEADVFAAQSRMESLQKATIDDFPQALVSPVISGLVTNAFQLEHELTALRASFGENWPTVVQKRDEVALVRDQLTREKQAVLAQAREQAILDYNSAENKRRMLASSLADQQVQVNRSDNATIQYNILRREVETNQKMYEGLLERLKQASVASERDLSGFRVVEPAAPTTLADGPGLKWNLMLASILGLALGVCIAIGRDYWDSSVSTIEQVEQLTMLPGLGSVPFVEAPVPARGLARLRSSSTAIRALPASPRTPPYVRLSRAPAAAEAIRNVCASILLSRSERPPRVLMVTSALPGEGKTTLALELAHTLTERGVRTLLVECDLRRPTFMRLFGLEKQGGLSLWLAGLGGTLPTVHDVTPELSVVVAGTAAPNPVALLNSDRLKTFLRDMRERYQFIILDAPPAMGVADARLLAPMTDGVVLVVRAGKVQRPLVKRVCALLHHAGASVLGAVLNGTEFDDSLGYYSEYYTKADAEA
ncbi:MAG: polysaccharide biosynthesis tyrosine autokinase [Vicinamibacterales bacterium]